MFRRTDTAQILLLLLTSLAPILESVGHDHAHEGEHACAVVDGSFFYLEAIDHDETDGHDHLVGYRLGDAHQHGHCGLCHPNGVDLTVPAPGQTYLRARQPIYGAARLEPGRVYSPDRPLRGPPQPN